MKQTTVAVFCLLFFLSGASFAQEVMYQDKPRTVTKTNTTGFNELELRKKMKNDGVPDAVIEKLIAKRKLLIDTGKNVAWTNVQRVNDTPVPFAPCSDMGGENGWGAWQYAIGTHSSGPPTYPASAPNPPAPNYSLTTGAGIDPCTPGANPGDPPLPFVAPGFGNASIQLGEQQMTGCVAEQATYPFTVTAADTNFIYAYAMVIQDAGHPVTEQPYVSLCIYDSNGNAIPCGCFTYTGGPSQPGFYTATCGFNTYYRPWTIVGVNLSAYIGQTLTIVIENVDCGQCGHFAHSYWDFSCSTLSGTASYFCPGQPASICAPTDPTITYTYQWYQNGNPYTGPPSATSQCITPIPQPGDTFVVEVQQSSGCNFHLVYIPTPFTIIPDFTFAGTCGNMTFTDISTTSSSTNPIANWNWQFPGGSPASSTSQNPGVISYPAGTYTATLVVSTAAGCADTIVHTITVGGIPTAAYSSTAPCLGSPTVFSDGSVAPQADPIVSWAWSFPGAVPATSSLQNPTVTYTTPGAHNVTLIVTTQSGCIDSIVQQVIIYNLPIAAFSDSAKGCRPLCVNFIDSSQAVDGNISSWVWSFPGGTPSSYNSNTSGTPPQICYNTPGNYNVSLTVTTNYGCTDTQVMNNYIHVYSWPDANFCIAPAQASVNEPLFTLCDLWTSDVNQWTWNFGDGTIDSSSTSTDPVHSYSASATNNDFYNYTISLYVENQFGCWDTITKTIELLPEYEFYIPNTFTPNGDFMNELFYGKCRGVKEYSIWLFDRWGNLIWDCHKSDKNINWDSDATAPKQEGLSSFCKWNGKVESGGMDMSGGSNQLSQEDVYVWKVRLTDIFDKKHMYIGNVNVVR